MRTLDDVKGNLNEFTDEELLHYAQNVTGASQAPFVPSIPFALRRLAGMVEEARK